MVCALLFIEHARQHQGPYGKKSPQQTPKTLIGFAKATRQPQPIQSGLLQSEISKLRLGLDGKICAS